MKPENIKFLDENRHHHDTLVKAFYLRSLSGVTRETMQRVMAEEFQPGYLTDLWCGPCVSDMVLALYRNYDNWIKEQPAEVEQEIPEPAFIEPVAPVIVAASFPSNLPKENKVHPNKKRRI